MSTTRLYAIRGWLVRIGFWDSAWGDLNEEQPREDEELKEIDPAPRRMFRNVFLYTIKG